MLEVRNLMKEYKTKNGPVVKALDGVSIQFEETGMVFILGKSGSGKSTLLNVLGGLDQADSGEVIVKGKSSRDFKQADFDSYRNTFIGFIFQDYNILEDFTISKNIGLALELQGRKSDKRFIEKLLNLVDLSGFGKRKPNTLSGGQKQRVAIARALVKNPQIIMADEPTGALDSNTGKQVLDTLKKLSKTKLVLIVSHDREFAEHYGDRVIELADGRVIRDVVKYKSEPQESDGLDIIDDKILTIKKGVKLDAAKTKRVKQFLMEHNEEDIVVSADSETNKEFKKIAKIDEEGNKESFKPTTDLNIKRYEGNKLKMIRSRLPGKDSFKMGASGLKSKPIRLILTILLSSIAFALFGLADTMGSYDKVNNAIISMQDTKVNYASLTKGMKEDPTYSWVQNMKLSEDDFSYLNDQFPGVKFYPVFNLQDNSNSFSYQDHVYKNLESGGRETLYKSELYGFMELNSSNQKSVGKIVAGLLPTKDDEIVLTKYTYEVFKEAGYKSDNKEVKIYDYADLLGKTIIADHYEGKTFKIVGIIDTSCDLTRYERMNAPDFGQTTSDYMLSNEFTNFLSTSFHALGYVNAGYYNNNVAISSNFEPLSDGAGLIGMLGKQESTAGVKYEYIAAYSSKLTEDDGVYYFDANKYNLASNEVIISYSALAETEFIVNGEPKRLVNMGNYSTCVKSEFNRRYQELLLSFNLPIDRGYENLILKYYASFDTTTYVYNSAIREWSGAVVSEIYNDKQKQDILSDFFKNFSVSGCVSADRYFMSEGARSQLREEYYKRFGSYPQDTATIAETGTEGSEDETQKETDTWEEYLRALANYTISGEWKYTKSINPGEQTQVNYAKRDIVKQIEPYFSKTFIAKTGVGYSHEKEYTLAGIYIGQVGTTNVSRPTIISTTLYNELRDSIGGIYSFAIASIDPDDTETLSSIVQFAYDKENETVVYQLNNPVMTSMSEINYLIETLASIFLYVGIGFAVFAALLLMNFITISISYKRREIGVLRAIGARGMDVFRIFFNEAFIIAFINFAIASAASIAVCTLINNVIRTDYGFLITILNIGQRQVILMFAMSLLVAFLSSFVPVSSIAKKKPIDAIRNT